MNEGHKVGQATHHDSRGYEICRSEAAAAGRAKFEGMIREGRANALRLLERVHSQRIDDALPSGAELDWDEIAILPTLPVSGAPVEAPGRFVMRVSDDQVNVHRHALGQLAARAGIPSAYLQKLLDSPNPALREQGRSLLRTHYHATELAKTPNLVRVVDGEARAVLSDSYRRLDSRPLLESFADVCKQFGAVPLDATMSDVRMQLKAILPHVFEPIPNEVLLVGLAWSNSDFGAGAHGCALTIIRVWCTNKATGEQCLRQVHLGRRLNADGIKFSQETIELDTKTHASVLRDVARQTLGPDSVNMLMSQIRDAHERGMTWDGLRKRIAASTTKGEQEQVRAAFEGADTQNLPAGKTAWRASNALSWIAGQTEDADRKLDLERLAGSLMTGKKVEAEETSA